MAPSFNPPPPQVDSHILISFPAPHVLLVTLNRASSMNCVSSLGNQQLGQIWDWYDATPALRCGIITGAQAPNRRVAFCAGMDLGEWNGRGSNRSIDLSSSGGFAGLSTRRGKKPIISAVHGICFGGGVEAAANTDVVVAHRDSTFALPEPSRGVAAIAGVLPRLTLTLGLQRASELALTGRVLTADEAREWGLVNDVVTGNVVDAALGWAAKITAQSPDSIIVTRSALRIVFDGDGVDEGMEKIKEGIWQDLKAGDNIREGLMAFVEKRAAKWKDSKL